jgi:hypothetical protein
MESQEWRSNFAKMGERGSKMFDMVLRRVDKIIKWLRTIAKWIRGSRRRIWGREKLRTDIVFIVSITWIVDCGLYENVLGRHTTEYMTVWVAQVQIGSHSFTFKHAYGSTRMPTTAMFNECVVPLEEDLFQGYNTTVLAYGKVCPPIPSLSSFCSHVPKK